MKIKNTLLVVIALILSVGFLFAQEATEAEAAAPAPTGSIDFVEMFQTSGPVAYLILFVFIIGVAYGIVRYIQLYVREKMDAEKFFVKLKNYVKNNQID